MLHKDVESAAIFPTSKTLARTVCRQTLFRSAIKMSDAVETNPSLPPAIPEVSMASALPGPISIAVPANQHIKVSALCRTASTTHYQGMQLTLDQTLYNFSGRGANQVMKYYHGSDLRDELDLGVSSSERILTLLFYNWYSGSSPNGNARIGPPIWKNKDPITVVEVPSRNFAASAADSAAAFILCVALPGDPMQPASEATASTETAPPPVQGEASTETAAPAAADTSEAPVASIASGSNKLTAHGKIIYGIQKYGSSEFQVIVNWDHFPSGSSVSYGKDPDPKDAYAMGWVVRDARVTDDRLNNFMNYVIVDMQLEDCQFPEYKGALIYLRATLSYWFYHPTGQPTLTWDWQQHSGPNKIKGVRD